MSNKDDKTTELKWVNKALKYLKGKTVETVEYMSNDEMEGMLWNNKPICIKFTDGTWIFPMCDDEGNDGGSLAYYKGGTTDTLPTLWWQSEEKKTVSIRDVNKEIAKEMNDADKTDKWVKENHQDIISTIGYRGEK